MTERAFQARELTNPTQNQSSRLAYSYDDSPPCSLEVLTMEKLAARMNVRVRRPDPGNAMAGPLIVGRRGDICKDGTGYSIAVIRRTSKGLTYALRELDFAKVRQIGDSEAVLYMAALPAAEEAEILRQILRVKMRRLLSEEHRAALIEAGKRHWFGG